MPWPQGRLQTDKEKAARAATRYGFDKMPPDVRLSIQQKGRKEAIRVRKEQAIRRAQRRLAQLRAELARG